MNILINIDEIEWDEWTFGKQYSARSKRLSDSAGGSAIATHMKELDAGKQSTPLHFHTAEEEHLFIVEGEVTLLQGDEYIHMIAGDYVCFLPGDDRGHALLNHTDAICRYLMIGQRDHRDSVVYPKEGQVHIKALDKIFNED